MSESRSNEGSGERGNHGTLVEKRRKKGNKDGEEKEEEEEDRKSGPLSSTSARVLAALMETRSRELPLTAAKPIYLRPRSLLPSLFSVHGSPLLEVASPSPFPPRAAPARRSTHDDVSLRSAPRRSRLSYSPSLARTRSVAGPPTRLQRGSCLTRGYFTFPCSPGRRSRRVAIRASNRGLTREVRDARAHDNT